MKGLLVFAAIIEASTGVSLLVVPSLVGHLLLGIELTGVIVGVAGIALIALAVACWPGPPHTRNVDLQRSRCALFRLRWLLERIEWSSPVASGHLARSVVSTFDSGNDQGDHPLSSIIIGVIVFACLFANALLGMLLRVRLPIHHPDVEYKDIIRLATAFVGHCPRLRSGCSLRLLGGRDGVSGG